SRDRKELSLNEQKREQWQKSFDKQRLAIENARRKYRGEKPLADIEALRDQERERALDPESETDSLKKDPYIKESGEILGDLMDLMNKPIVAKED
ncbi:MAG: carboxy terminal-processing peptidase, partial [Alcanivorax sp.]|nr:carboxy terminal-processing peptidase [Alcanivorax sp.]